MNISENEYRRLRDNFRLLDKDGDGKITVDEFKSVMTRNGRAFTDEEIYYTIQKYDKNGDNCVEFSELLEGMTVQHNQETVKTVEAREASGEEYQKAFEIFSRFDADGSGRISKEELKQGLKDFGMHLDEEKLEEMFSTLDEDQNGALEYSEFIKILQIQ